MTDIELLADTNEDTIEILSDWEAEERQDEEQDDKFDLLPF